MSTPAADRSRLFIASGAAGTVGLVSTTADDVTSAAARPLSAHHPSGISTGVFASARGDWPELVAEACRISTFAVELSALSGDELPGLIAYLRTRPRMPFRYASVHAPVKNREPDEAATITMLDDLPLWVRSVVAHPDALSDVGLYRALRYGGLVPGENMDDRKITGRVADEMEKFFEELPDAGFCLRRSARSDPAVPLSFRHCPVVAHPPARCGFRRLSGTATRPQSHPISGRPAP